MRCEMSTLDAVRIVFGRPLIEEHEPTENGIREPPMERHGFKEHVTATVDQVLLIVP